MLPALFELFAALPFAVVARWLIAKLCLADEVAGLRDQVDRLQADVDDLGALLEPKDTMKC